jgi:S1-C subfamily serine protease
MNRSLTCGLVLVAAATLSSCGSNGHAGTSNAGAAAAAPPAGSSGGAYALQSRFTEVVKAVSPTVVHIGTSEGLGSGVVYDGHGDIVTNAHVVGTSTMRTVTLANGKRGSATLVGTFAANDLAVIDSGMGELRPASFGDSASLAVGDVVLAVGNPLGLRSSVTDGIVSSLGRTVSEENGATLPSVIQTTAPINPATVVARSSILRGR